MQGSQNLRKKKLLPILELVIFGLLTAILVAVQVGLAWLANVELVSTLIILYTIFLGRKVLFPLYAFVIIQGLLYGFHIWWIAYLYVWLVLVLLTHIFKKIDSAIFFAVLAGIFGLIFGTLCSIPYLFIGGWQMFVSTIIAGISFDLVHCVGNFVITLILYRPLKNLFAMLFKRMKVFKKESEV